MPGENKEAPEGPERKILSPFTYWVFSSALLAVILVPFSVGAFYILQISVKYFHEKLEYSVLGALAVGIILSVALGYILSIRARKRAESTA